VEAEKKKKQRLTTSSPGPNGSTSSPARAGSEGWSGDASKRKWATDGVDIKRTGVPTRDNCVGLLYDGLAYMSTESTTQIILKSMEVERAAFTAFKGETPEYRNKLRSLFQNLKNKTNRELGPRVLSGEISAEKFVVMTHEELKSAKQREEDNKLEAENMKKAQVPMAQKSISDALKCGRCGQKKVSYSQAQTRSADEPMTTFCECTVCGNRWKVIFFLCSSISCAELTTTSSPEHLQDDGSVPRHSASSTFYCSHAPLYWQ
jgi:transcription elongation factor S-II